MLVSAFPSAEALGYYQWPLRGWGFGSVL